MGTHSQTTKDTKDINATAVESGEKKAVQSKLKSEDQRRNAYLLKTYGITIEEWYKLLAVHHAKCWLCGRYPTTRTLNVDHRHVVGEKKRPLSERRERVRGLLCFFCNKYVIGRRTDPELFKKAAAYLESTKAQEILGEKK